MNRDIMPTIDEYVKYSLLVEDTENSLIELEKLIIKAKKAKEEEFEHECLFRYYMSSTYINFSKELNEEELKYLIEKLNKKVRELSSRVKTLNMIKMKKLLKRVQN